MQLQVLSCDNHLLVVLKPPGVPTQADASGDPDLLSLARAWVEREFHKPGKAFLGLVHRLDRPAQGVVVFARTSKAAARLQAQFAGRDVEKTYRVVVHGRPPLDHGTLEHHLVSDERGSKVVTGARGKAACLDYRVIGAGKGKTLLEVDLHTGRKHQIRVQLAAIGCPVVGDLRYGACEPLPDRSIALLAWRLRLDHPTTKERLEFTAPLPTSPGWDVTQSTHASP